MFIWGPLLSDTNERQEVMQMLQYFEKAHSWRTAWILDALKEQWGIDTTPDAKG